MAAKVGTMVPGAAVGVPGSRGVAGHRGGIGHLNLSAVVLSAASG